ncbi:MAG: Gfo/Idh/MocA family oxidoreductase [Clostridiales bacterium]|nr:Gfo/Idh/MocA family oxidoreductase [Clostridiales bacterium]
MRIGIIGCQSKHAEFFGALLNRERIVDGARATHICAVDEPARLPYVLEKAEIPNVCESAEELVSAIDAALVTTRRAETHLPYARLCLEAGKPVFVDKPFAAASGEAGEMVRLSAERNVPLMAGSTFCFLPEIPAWRAALSEAKSILLRYWADPDSPFGGFSFYGSHLTDLASALFDGARRVFAARTGEVVSCVVEYDKRQVILQTSAQHGAVEAVCDKEGSLHTLRLDDGNCYARGLEAFFRAVRDGVPDGHHDRLIASVRLLSAVNESLRTGLPQRVEDF